MQKHLLIVTGLVSWMLMPAVAGEEGDRVVAKIGERTITASQFERILKTYDAERTRHMKRNPRFKALVLQKYVEGIVLANKARERGLDQLPEVRDRISMATNQILAQAYLQREIESIAPSEADILAYYETHQAEFKKPAQANVRQIFVKADPAASAEDKRKVKKRAEELRKRLLRGEDFAALAEQFSDDPQAGTRGGSLGFVRRGFLLPEIDNVVFSLPPGQVSDVIQTPRGYCLVKVDEIKESSVEPLEVVKEQVRSRLLIELKRRAADGSRAKALKEVGVELYALDAIEQQSIGHKPRP